MNTPFLVDLTAVASAAYCHVASRLKLLAGKDLCLVDTANLHAYIAAHIKRTQWLPLSSCCGVVRYPASHRFGNFVAHQACFSARRKHRCSVRTDSQHGHSLRRRSTGQAPRSVAASSYFDFEDGN
ncbi:hypothetical protein BURKHO8Y_250011 [Burkholderia sp. 8Y]|nr:hypothetical protein BURKHO8Y_250011 [Burkholderia sp. 8Y]